MDLIRHTITWTQGEIFEALLIGLFGVATVLAGAAFWTLGTTNAAKALFVPLLVVGLLFVLIGGASYVNNQRRIPKFEQAHAEDPATFMQAEKARVEGFQYMYTITMIVAAACLILASSLFWFSLNANLRAAGVALVVIGLAGLLIDFFSKERADTYYEAIQAELGARRSSRPTSISPCPTCPDRIPSTRRRW